MVVNLQNDKYTPNTKGAKKKIKNAIAVGNAKIGKYFLIALSITTFLPILKGEGLILRPYKYSEL